MTRGGVTPQRIAWAAAVSLGLGLAGITLAWGYSATGWIKFLQTLAVIFGVASVAVGLMWLAVARLADWHEPESEAEFERVVMRAEELAQDGLGVEPDEPDFMELDPYDPDDFDELVRDALDDLPRDFQLALKHVAVVVSDGGRRAGAYGLYHGDTVARDNHPERILIYRDTLLRDFGRDPDLLREQVTRTVRHELAHFLGWDEDGVRGLGL